MRYEYTEDVENDCITIIDEKGELKTDFDSNIILWTFDDAITVVDKLNWYELLVQEMKSHLEYHGWTEEDFKGLIEDVEAMNELQ